MLLWLMNLGFAGGSGATVATPSHVAEVEAWSSATTDVEVWPSNTEPVTVWEAD